MKTKYTKEKLEEIKGCVTVSEALIKLGFLSTGGHKGLRKLIKDYLEETGTYKGKSVRKGSVGKRKSDDIFFSNGQSKRSTWAVRNALFNRGLKEKKCECCKNTEWNGKPIPLEVHHKDGDKYNNELENLEILCPNCHYFTDTYKVKNIKPV